MEIFQTGNARWVWLTANLFGVVALSIGVLAPNHGAWRTIQWVFAVPFLGGYAVCFVWGLYVHLIKNRRRPALDGGEIGRQPERTAVDGGEGADRPRTWRSVAEWFLYTGAAFAIVAAFYLVPKIAVIVAVLVVLVVLGSRFVSWRRARG